MTPKVYQGWHRNNNVSLVLCSGQEVPLDSIAIDLAPASKLAGSSGM
jgi:hypothetical protein